MRLETINDKKTGEPISVGDIVTAVFYEWKEGESESPLYPFYQFNKETKKVYVNPQTANNKSAVLIQFKSTTTGIDSKDFKEYGYKYTVDKGKYADYNLASIMGPEVTFDLAECDSEMLDKISSYSVPTLYRPTKTLTSSIKMGFFSSKLQAGKTVYQFEAPANCYKIELYDENLYLDLNKMGIPVDKDFGGSDVNMYREPVISIYFGPHPESSNNPDNYYTSGDYYLDENSKNRKPNSSYAYRLLMDELRYDKVVTLIMSTGAVQETSINMAQASFYDSKNPMRNLNKIALRNDEWRGTKDSINQVGIRDNSLYDLTTGTLLGNRGYVISPETTPILSEKITHSEITNFLGRFSINHTYSKGNSVSIGKMTFKSVTDNNRGNFPLTSPEWVINSSFSGSFTTLLNLTISPEMSGVISQNHVELTDYNNNNIEFTLTANLGYSPLNKGTELMLGGEKLKNYKVTDLGDNKYKISGNSIDGFFASEIKKIAKLSGDRELILRLELVPEYLYRIYFGTEYEEVPVFINEEKKVETTYTKELPTRKDIVLEAFPGAKCISVSVKKEYEKFLECTKIIAEYTLPNREIIPDIELIDLSDGNFLEIEELRECPRILYSAFLEQKKKRIKILFDAELWEVEKSFINIHLGCESLGLITYSDPLRFYYIGKETTVPKFTIRSAGNEYSFNADLDAESGIYTVREEEINRLVNSEGEVPIDEIKIEVKK